MSEHASDQPQYLMSGPFPVERPGYDGKIYRWYIGTHGHPIDVKFTATLVAVGAEGASARAEQALLTDGKSELVEFLSWKEPPEEIEFSTDNWPSVSGGVLE